MRVLTFIGLLILLFCDFSGVWAQFTQTGMASYYASEFHGKQTACGERYNMHELTAAHPTLPFNTKVKVTNLTNKKYVIVRINDRGPHTKRRIIDLSKAAAKKIGLIQSGIVKVKVEVIDKENELRSEKKLASKETNEQSTLTKENKEVESEKKTDAEIASKSNLKLLPGNLYNENGKLVNAKGYGIQLISLTDLEKVEQKLADLKPKFKEIFIQTTAIKGKTTYRIIVGEYAGKSLAKKDVSKFSKMGYKGFVKKF